MNWFLRVFGLREKPTTEFESMKIVVGLGNPGSQYQGTRHNVGFDVIESLNQKFAFGERSKSKFKANVNEVMIGTTKVMLVTPLTYMNLSGQTVRAAIDFFKLDLEDLMVICDDLNLEVGRIRLRAKGSAGGQNGIKDIINRVGSQEFPRLRLGIGKPPAHFNTADYVLGKFDDLDRALVKDSVAEAAKAVEFWVKNGILATMNQFNANPNAKSDKKPIGKKKMKSDAEKKQLRDDDE